MLESTETNEAHEPTEKAEEAEPSDPIEKNDPTDPIENDEPTDAIEQNESFDHSDHPVRRTTLSVEPGSSVTTGSSIRARCRRCRG